MGLRARLEAGGFAFTAEVTPPLSPDPRLLIERAAPLKGLADAVNVTDAAGARVALSPFAAAAILAAEGHDPVVQLTCRDRNRIAIAGELLGAAAQGVTNLLVLHGDDPAGGDMPEAKPVHDLDSRGVMSLARTLRDEGRLPAGREVKPAPAFYIGGADSPRDPEPGWKPESLLAKAEAGADFIQTQFCFDAAVVARYAARLAEHGLTDRLKILIGLAPLASARQARWMDENLFGVSVPEAVIARLEGAADQAAEGRALCLELIEALRAIPGIAGVHLMAPLQGAEAIARMIQAAGK